MGLFKCADVAKLPSPEYPALFNLPAYMVTSPLGPILRTTCLPLSATNTDCVFGSKHIPMGAFNCVLGSVDKSILPAIIEWVLIYDTSVSVVPKVILRTMLLPVSEIYKLPFESVHIESGLFKSEFMAYMNGVDLTRHLFLLYMVSFGQDFDVLSVWNSDTLFPEAMSEYTHAIPITIPMNDETTREPTPKHFLYIFHARSATNKAKKNKITGIFT